MSSVREKVLIKEKRELPVPAQPVKNTDLPWRTACTTPNCSSLSFKSAQRCSTRLGALLNSEEDEDEDEDEPRIDDIRIGAGVGPKSSTELNGAVAPCVSTGRAYRRIQF